MTMHAAQFDLFGGMAPPAHLNLQDRVRWILNTYPATRDDDRLLVLRYWLDFDGLGELLDADAIQTLERFLSHPKTANPETLRRRRQELQRLDSGGSDETLAPSDSTKRWRKSRAHAGPPRR